MQQVIFKMPPFEEFYNDELLTTAKDFYYEGILNAPFSEVLINTKYKIFSSQVPSIERDLLVDLQVEVTEKVFNGNTNHKIKFNVKDPSGEWVRMPFETTCNKEKARLSENVLETGGAFDDKEEMTMAVAWQQEVMMMCLMVMNLPQYEHKKVEVSEKVNRKRDKKGKKRLKDYIQLQLKKEYRSGLSGKGGGSPKPHWRRGHIRRLANGKHTPVSPCLVNFNGETVKPKEYRLGDNHE